MKTIHHATQIITKNNPGRKSTQELNTLDAAGKGKIKDLKEK